MINHNVHEYKNIVVIGSTGSIGRAFTEGLSSAYPNAVVHAFSRHPAVQNQANVVFHEMDYQSEGSIGNGALIASKEAPLDMVIVATGILHDAVIFPEKSLPELSADKFRHAFEINTILPALIAKHFLPRLNKNDRTIFAALSARVGSITDNKLGGWYAYW